MSWTRFTCALPSKVTGLGQWPGWASWVPPNPMGWTEPGPKKQWVGSGLWAQPVQFVLLRVCFVWQNTPLCLGHNFYAHSNLIFGQRNPFLIIVNFKNILGSFLIYLWAPRTLFYFFPLCLYFFVAMCSIGRLLLLNTNMSCNALFYFHLKRVNNNKG
jgi:hypothetical protein